jgi:hypothetical protein
MLNRRLGLGRPIGAEMDLKEYLDFQTREIERHKWIESEKAGRDLGLDAVIDWIQRYADAFSDHFIHEKCRD